MAFRWVNPLNALRARRQMLALIYDTTDRKRQQWTALRRGTHAQSDWVLDRSDVGDSFSFIVLGDTGEGDTSQMVIVDKFIREGADTAFSIISSDVIYPAGRSKDYREKFYVPYRAYKKDIYAVPGNHDWYDELVGFMAHMCNELRTPRRPNGGAVHPQKVDGLRKIRSNTTFQPNMYFAIDTPAVRIVGVDTGIKGRIDPEQEEWLRRVSAGPKPKIMVLGKPIYANGRYDERLANVDRVISAENYVLVIAGDTHNFQKYRVPVNGRVVWHLVNGGGGAYLRRTDDIPHVHQMELPVQLRSEPEDFDCYPTREVSKSCYDVRPFLMRHLPSLLADNDQPPYHQSFLKIDVRPNELRVRVFAVEDFTDEWVNKPAYFDWNVPI